MDDLGFLKEEIGRLEFAAGKDAIVIYFHPEMGKGPEEQDLWVISQLTKSLTHKLPFNLFINVSGGRIDMAERYIGALKWYEGSYDVNICNQALSAGGLIAFSGSHVIMHPFSVLSPLDPILSSKNGGYSMPSEMSSEDIRNYINMSTVWFNLSSELNRKEILENITQNISSISLSQLYRAEYYIIRKLSRLLISHIESKNIDDAIIAAKNLVHGYPSHQHKICYHDLIDMGIRVIRMKDDIYEYTSRMTKTCQVYCENHERYIVNGVMFTRDRFYEHRIASKTDTNGNNGSIVWYSEWQEVEFHGK